ncbi:hypothetical protein ABW19_dt0207033 [Dactylella cylindrospora]|nr:hypothetical protein ABW19_dt0207033 [Dactylella cylindrospora]
MRILTPALLYALLALCTCNNVLASGVYGEAIHKRQAEDSTEASPAPSTTAPPRTRSTNSDSEETTEPTRTTGGGQTRTNPSTTGTRAKTYVDPRSPPGGVVMQTPVTTSGSQYYKIGNPITFGWNYTSLIISPSAVNVEAFCSDNSQTYTIAQNLSIAKPSVVWDTGSYTPENDQPPLAM